MESSTIVPQNNGKTQQFITAAIVNLAAMSFGTSCGWASPMIPQLRSNELPVGDTPLNSDQISWISSLMPLGGLLTIPFCGMLSERLGRKNFAIVTALPHIVSWILIIFAQNYIHLYVARFAGGMGGAMSLFIAPLYVSEIASVDIRGSLGSLVLFAVNIGVLFAYVAGAYLSYRLFAILCLIFPVVYVVVILFIPETPVYLVLQNRQVEAHESLMLFRGNNQALVEQELTSLRSQATISDNSCKRVSLKEFFGDRATRKGLIISMGLIAAQTLSGVHVMITYVESIFQLAGSSVSSEIASIIIAIIQIVGSQMSTLLIERAGRRLLSLISCIGTASSHFLVGLFFYLQSNKYDVSSFSWLPLIAMSAYIITFSVGMGPVPFVIMSELFKLDFASFATNICMIFYWSAIFMAFRIFDLSMQIFGVDGCFFTLATFCFIGFVFCYCLLPETKGRQREDITNELAGIDEACRDQKIHVHL